MINWKHPSIIAIEGPPFTGKSFIAWDLACHLRQCLLISLDEILEAISSDAQLPPQAQVADQLTSQAFDILCGLVEKQLSLGVSVIIDYLPRSRAGLNRLAGLSKSSNAAKFVVIECQIDKSKEYAWQRRFEEAHMAVVYWQCSWYKPQSWEEVRKALIKRSHTNEFEEHVEGVSRLMLNVDTHVRGRHIIQAIQSLIFCPDDRHLEFGKWNENNPGSIHSHGSHSHHGHDEGGKHPPRFCEDGHAMSVLEKETVAGHEANCGVCGNPAVGATYACNSCDLTLHKSCAEMQFAPNRSFTPNDFPHFITKSTDPPAYSFPENFPCFVCREAGRGFSDQCSSCIYESHLKNRLIPTIIEHAGHDQHKLYLWAMKIKNKGAYNCVACGEEGAYVAYACNQCNVNYHVECALLPYPVQNHNHGGHQHPLQLMFTREETDFDDFPCDHCPEMMNPEDWYYHCGECAVTYHLKCAFLKEDC